jgi:hypothetical protein
MAKVTNTLGRSVTVPTGVVKDGLHQTLSFKPGETKTLTAEQMKAPGVFAYLHAEVLTEDKELAAAAAAEASPSATPSRRGG